MDSPTLLQGFREAEVRSGEGLLLQPSVPDVTGWDFVVLGRDLVEDGQESEDEDEATPDERKPLGGWGCLEAALASAVRDAHALGTLLTAMRCR